MSREIKFRVWDKDVCAYIDRKHTFDFTNYLRLNFDEGNGIAIGSLCPGRYIYEQYTGLKDKNGKEIYKGDIVKTTSPDRSNFEAGVLAMQQQMYVIMNASTYQDKRLSHCEPLGYYCDTEIEVIGNIHENPELLDPCNSTESGENK